MSNQLQITGGAKVRSLEGVITGTTGVLGSLPINTANGIPQLDSNGKILVSQLPNSVMEYQGTWNVSTNTPYLVNGVGNAGDVYLVTGAATGGTNHNFGAGNILFFNGDQAIYDGSAWQRASGSTGTVTSVAITESGDALSITGSPITTSGTINIGFAGTSAQYVAGDGTLITFPALTGYVPYTGATATLDMGAYDVNARGFKVNGTAGNGHVDFKHQSGVPTGSASSTTLFANSDGDMEWKNDHNYLTTLSTHANTADRVYTFPDASGTLALTTDIANFTANSPLSYSGGVLSISQSGTSTNGYLSSTDWNTFNNKQNALGFTPIGGSGSTNYIAKFTGSTTISQSAIYEGATGYVSIGNTNTSYNLDVSGTGRFTNGVLASTFSTNSTSGITIGIDGSSNGGALRFVQNTSASVGGPTESSLSVYSNTKFYFYAGISSGVYKGFYLDNGLLSNNTIRTYQLPDASGTLALSSQLSGVIYGSGSTYQVAWFNATNSIAGSGNLYFDPVNNRLGIGTTNPQRSLTIYNATTDNHLQIAGSAPSVSLTDAVTGAIYQAKFGLATGSGQYVAGAVAGDFVIISQTGATIWANSGGERMRLTSGGNVGIGTTSPISPANSYRYLHIEGGNSTSGGVLYLSTSGNGNSSQIYADTSGLNINTNTSLPIIFSPAGSERMRITSTGNLLLGLTSSTYETTNRTSIVANGTSTSLFGLVVGGVNKGYIYSEGTNILLMSESATGYMSFGTANTEKMRITSGGNVGIGTTSFPSFTGAQQMTMKGGASNTNSVFQVQSYDAGTSLTIYSGAASSDDPAIIFQKNLRFGSTTDTGLGGYVERMRITSGGNVGIGNTGNSTVRLFIDGSTNDNTAYVQYSRSNNGTTLMYVRNDGYGYLLDSAWHYGSDIRLKENINDVTEGLSVISKLKPKHYDYINAGKNKVGFIAQDVQEILPNLVSVSNEETGILALQTDALIPYLVKAIQEQQAQIEQLKSQLN